MNYIALKMLMGDRGKYLGIVMGLTFASLIMTQQPAIFVGFMMRTYSFITDVGLPDIWVMDPKVQFVDDVKPLQDMKLFRVRGIEGVDWAMPLYKGLIKARLANGNFQTCNVIGLDDATLIGGPPQMLEGRIEDLRRSDAVIVDRDGAVEKLGVPGPGRQTRAAEGRGHPGTERPPRHCRRHRQDDAHLPVAAGGLHHVFAAPCFTRRASASCCPSSW